MRTIIVSESMGVVLGSCMGLGFWNKLDAAGQNAAITFESEKAIRDYIATWEGLAALPSDMRYLDVEADIDNEFASIAACVKAGAEA